MRRRAGCLRDRRQGGRARQDLHHDRGCGWAHHHRLHQGQRHAVADGLGHQGGERRAAADAHADDADATATLCVACPTNTPTPTPTATPTPTNTPPTNTPHPPPTPCVELRRTTFTDRRGLVWAADKAYATGSWGYVGGSTGKIHHGGRGTTGRPALSEMAHRDDGVQVHRPERHLSMSSCASPSSFGGRGRVGDGDHPARASRWRTRSISAPSSALAYALDTYNVTP